MLTKRQLKIRLRKVMASSAAALLERHPYVSRFEAWAQAMGLAEGPEYSDAMRMGDVLEATLVKEAARRLGWPKKVRKMGTVFHQNHLWAGCTPDGVKCSNGEFIGMQVKNSGIHMAKGYQGQPGEGGEWDNDLIPAYHNFQCQWEMFVMNANSWHLVVYFGGADFRIYNLRRDADLIQLMSENLWKFWLEHIDPDGPQTEPLADGGAGTGDFLRRRHPKNDGNLLPPSDEHYDLAERYRSLGARVKENEKARDGVKHQLMQAIGAADGIEGVCTWKLTSPKPKTDWKGVAGEFEGDPDYQAFFYDHTTTPDGNRTFRISTSKEA
ncbi:hypothetical protein LCGC14_1018190 [marine sediment metagenome]|uniref:YqaJ viral recombinase domain-containing protein n=1 Tax=marine sediment metagenome TaxID=412755 RepID=A0A0F9NJW8_9ZZZZ